MAGDTKIQNNISEVKQAIRLTIDGHSIDFSAKVSWPAEKARYKLTRVDAFTDRYCLRLKSGTMVTAAKRSNAVVGI